MEKVAGLAQFVEQVTTCNMAESNWPGLESHPQPFAACRPPFVSLSLPVTSVNKADIVMVWRSLPADLPVCFCLQGVFTEVVLFDGGS